MTSIAESVKSIKDSRCVVVSSYSVSVRDLPEGFEKIGARGCTRAPLRSGDWVFKVGSESVNRVEVSKTEQMRNDPELPVWCFVPEAHLVDGVCVQEYIPGVERLPDCYGGCYCGLKPECWQVRARFLEDRYGLSDLHYENVCALANEDGSDYVLAVFDLGCGLSGEMWDDED